MKYLALYDERVSPKNVIEPDIHHEGCALPCRVSCPSLPWCSRRALGGKACWHLPHGLRTGRGWIELTMALSWGGQGRLWPLFCLNQQSA